jgi:hypothetical protein
MRDRSKLIAAVTLTASLAIVAVVFALGSDQAANDTVRRWQ